MKEPEQESTGAHDGDLVPASVDDRTSGSASEPAATSSSSVDAMPPSQQVRRAAPLRRAGMLAALFAVPFCIIGLAFALDRALATGHVLRGVWAGQLSLSGLDAAELDAALGAIEERIGNTPVRLRARTELFAVRPKQLDYRIDKQALHAQAMSAGRQGSIVDQFRFWWAGFTRHRRLVLAGSLGASTDKVLADIENRAIPDAPYEGGISVRDGRVRAEKPRPGQSLDGRAARRLLLEAINQRRQTVVELPIRTIEPSATPASVEAAASRAEQMIRDAVELFAADELRVRFEAAELAAALRSRTTDRGDIELYFSSEILDRKLNPLRPQIESTPRSATYAVDHKDRLIVIPSRHSLKLSTRLVAEALAETSVAPARVGPLPLLRDQPPALTTEELLALQIKGRVASFTTRHACCQPRVKNIHRIADLLDGIVLRPGETLSVNEVVGPRTQSNGFVPAPSIEDGEMVDTVGGGISQFATTLFNAVLHGGYAILERAPHTYYFSRYPMGHEATLSYPKPDLVFKNDSAAGLLIKTAYGETSITVTLYGDNGGRKVETEVSPQFDLVEPPVDYVPNAELDPAKERRLSRGQVGWSVNATRIVTFTDGQTKREQRKVIYKPRTATVEVHPCRIPKGQPNHTGEPCPEPEEPDASVPESEFVEAVEVEPVE